MGDHLALAEQIVRHIEHKTPALDAAFADMRRGEYRALADEIVVLIEQHGKSAGARGPDLCRLENQTKARLDAICGAPSTISGHVYAPVPASKPARPRRGGSSHDLDPNSTRSLILRVLDLEQGRRTATEICTLLATVHGATAQAAVTPVANALHGLMRDKLVQIEGVPGEYPPGFGITAAGRAKALQLRSAVNRVAEPKRRGPVMAWNSNRSHVLRALEIADQPLRLNDAVDAVAKLRGVPVEAVGYFSVSAAIRDARKRGLVARGPAQRAAAGPFGSIVYHRYWITAAGRELVAKMRAALGAEQTAA